MDTVMIEIVLIQALRKMEADGFRETAVALREIMGLDAGFRLDVAKTLCHDLHLDLELKFTSG